MSVCIVHEPSQFVLGCYELVDITAVDFLPNILRNHRDIILYFFVIVVDVLADVVIEFSIIIDQVVSNQSVECLSATYCVDQFIDVLYKQTHKILIPMVAEVLNFVVSFSTVGN